MQGGGSAWRSSLWHIGSKVDQIANAMELNVSNLMSVPQVVLKCWACVSAPEVDPKFVDLLH